MRLGKAPTTDEARRGPVFEDGTDEIVLAERDAIVL